MRKHTKIYYDTLGYAIDEFVACEICGQRAVDIHHIDCRGMGGSKEKDKIENLMAVCRKCHIQYGDKKEHTEWLKDIHNKFITGYGKR
jgi:5-methylcytosine-specific restriction endonuclease McrA